MSSLTDALPKVVHTDRLTLELFDHSEAHWECLLAIVNNKTAYETMGDHGIHTVAQFDALLKATPLSSKVCRGKTCEEAVYYLMRLKKDSSLMGGISMAQRGEAVPPDIGWCVAEAYMGQGYATEGASKILQLFQEEVGVEEILTWPGETNLGSIRVAEKIGMVKGETIYGSDGKGQLIYVLPGMKTDQRWVLDFWGNAA